MSKKNMDLKEKIYGLLEQAQYGPDEQRARALDDLRDYMEYHEFPPELLAETCTMLMEMACIQYDPAHRNLTFRVLQAAFTGQKWREPDVDILVDFFSEDDPLLIAHTLQLMPFTGNRKYLPVAQAYVLHSHPAIRHAAAYAIKHLES